MILEILTNSVTYGPPDIVGSTVALSKVTIYKKCIGADKSVFFFHLEKDSMQPCKAYWYLLVEIMESPEKS